jgi:hypothetical protein
VHKVHGVDPVALRPMVDNRFRPGLADVVCTAAQNAVCLIEIGDAPFDEVLRRASRSARSAAKHAYADPWDVQAVIDQASAELDTDCFLNNRLHAGSAGDHVPARASAFRWTRRDDKAPVRRLIVQIDDIPYGVRISLHVNTKATAPAEAEALAWAMESVALAEAGA